MKPLRIAFVSAHPSVRRFRKDGSFIYRCENLSLALAAMGHKVSLLHISALLFRTDFDIVVFMRPVRSWLFDHAVRRLRARGALLIGDVDDLIFDPECAQFRPSVKNRLADLARTRDKFMLHAQALEQMDKVQFATSELARRYLAIYPDAECTVIPNAAHRSWSGIAPVAGEAARCISYLSGTRTHDRDLALVTPVLERLLQRHADLVLQVVGPVSVSLQHPRVRRIDKVGFADYAGIVRSSHLCIVPLEDTPFNRCKSALKAFEAGAMNVPTVVSPVGEYAEMRVEGMLHASSAREWEAQLEFALDAANYRTLSAGLRERMGDASNVDRSAMKFVEFATRDPKAAWRLNGNLA
jgi:glycosyltransferase involved in cell wall biosynthesis